MSNIITTGINIVATGVNRATQQIRQFGSNIAQVERQANTFANSYSSTTRRVQSSSLSLSNALGRNWANMYRSAVSGTRNQERQLRALETSYDRTFRNIGNKYQSMVMGSVALSMSGIGIQNKGMKILGGVQTTLNQARDFETVMRQIQFYGKRTADQMATIKKNIFSMGYNLPVSTSQIANSVLEAQKTGYNNMQDSLTMGKEASKIQFMSMGKMQGDEALKYISQLRKMFGTKVGDTHKITDKLAMTADVSSASIDSLWKTIESSRTAYNSLGTDPNNFLTLAGVMSDRLTPKQAGMALSSFGGGVQMAEKAGRENRGSRGKYYNQLTKQMGGNFDSYHGDILKYIQDVSKASQKLWGNGSERKGNLQSMFGKSAVDLFYAYEQFTKQTGQSMTTLRKEISNSDGHAQKLIDTLMNGSYGTEQRLKALVEQFQILFGTAIRPAFNKILDVLNGVLTKVNKFIQMHPKIAKVLGYGVGLAGLLMTVTGASMLFVGGLLAIYASLNNVIIQIARNTRAVALLKAGYETAGQMVKAQMLGPLKLLGMNLLKLGGLSFFLYMAWKHDFLGMRTTFLDWYKSIESGLQKSKKLFGLYAKGSVSEFDKAMKKSEASNTLSDVIGRRLAKVGMAWNALRTMFKNHGILPKDQYKKLKDSGLLPFIQKIYDIGTAVKDFWKGFIKGVKSGLEILKPILHPLVVAFQWLYNKALALAKHFGYFKNESNGITSKWEKWGQTVGNIVGMVIAIRVGLFAWGKALKIATSPFRMIFNFGNKTLKLLKLLAKIKINPFKGMAKLLIPKGIRNKISGYHRTIRERRMTGAYSQLPNARRNIDPQTGQPVINPRTGQPSVSFDEPQNWRERRRLRRARRNAPTIFNGENGSSRTVRGRGVRGRLRDFWQGREYIPDQNVDSRGRTYNSVRTREGRYTRTTAEGHVNGRRLRTGGFRGGVRNGVGRVRGGVGRVRSGLEAITRRGRMNRAIMNAENFAEAGMDYASSVGTRGHRLRSVRAGVRAYINRSRRMGIRAGGASRFRGAIGLGEEALSMTGRGRGIGGMFKGIGKVLDTVFKKIPWGTIAKDGGKGLLRGFGFVLKKGLPMVFKIGFRAIPFLGEALMAWDIISTIFKHWGPIKKYAGIALRWIGKEGGKLLGIMWSGIKTVAGNVWNAIKTKAGQTWTHIKDNAKKRLDEAWTQIKTGWHNLVSGIETGASNAWTNIKKGIAKAFSNLFQPIKDAWNNAKNYVSNNPIVQTVKKVTQTISQSKWNPLNWGKGHRTGLWNVPKENYQALLHKGEMVLTQREAQILRSMVGNDNNSVAQTLLGGQKKEASISVAKPTKKMRTINPPKITINKQDKETKQAGKTEITFKENSVNIQVSNASPSEMKKGAKQMLEEFKRMVELDNMKNYRPARPKRPRPV